MQLPRSHSLAMVHGGFTDSHCPSLTWMKLLTCSDLKHCDVCAGKTSFHLPLGYMIHKEKSIHLGALSIHDYSWGAIQYICLLYSKVSVLSAEQDADPHIHISRYALILWNLCIVLQIHTVIMATLQVRVATRGLIWEIMSWNEMISWMLINCCLMVAFK